MNKNHILTFLCFLLVLVIKYNLWPSTSTNAPQNTTVKRNDSIREEKIATEYDDGLQEVYVYNKETNEESVIYRKQHEIERRTRNIKFIQKTNTPYYNSPEEYDAFTQRQEQQKSRIQRMIQEDERKDNIEKRNKRKKNK